MTAPNSIGNPVLKVSYNKKADSKGVVTALQDTYEMDDDYSVSLFKCPFCNFVNVYEDTITHHIRHTDDAIHCTIDMDINILGKSSYIRVNQKPKSSPYGPYISAEELELQWVKCLWCSYRDKVQFDLSLHFREKHRDELLAIPITRAERLAAKALSSDWYARFERPMEYRLDKANDMAQQKSVRQRTTK